MKGSVCVGWGWRIMGLLRGGWFFFKGEAVVEGTHESAGRVLVGPHKAAHKPEGAGHERSLGPDGLADKVAKGNRDARHHCPPRQVAQRKVLDRSAHSRSRVGHCGGRV